MTNDLFSQQIFGDIWRGCTGIAGSSLAIVSASHELVDNTLRTAGIIVGLLVGIASLISLCQRIVATHRKEKWNAVIFKEVEKDKEGIKTDEE